jgi:L-aspartate oxidase
VLTDRDGRTGLDGLFAVGEVACTGVHGANRLASNSLLEAVVFSHRAARAVRAELDAPRLEPHTPVVGDPGVAGDEWRGVQKDLRALMWADCGIVRSDARLDEALEQVSALRDRAHRLFAAGPVDTDLAETRNLCDVALLMVRSARMRKESRGLHFNVDHPLLDDAYRADTVIHPARGD